MGQDHHFVPQFYLSGFTANGRKNGKLWESDLGGGTQQQASPAAVAKRKGFYRVKLEGEDPEAVENELQKIETAAAPIIKKIAATGCPPAGRDELHALLKFAGIQAVRIPKERRRIVSFIERARKDLSTPETWAVALGRNGRPTDLADYDEVRRDADSSNHLLFIAVMIQGWRIVTEALEKRNWVVRVSC